MNTRAPAEDHQPLVSVVVVNWNGAEHIDECLQSVASQTIANEIEVVVVDNGSQDGSLEILDRFRERIRLIANPRNLGFSPGCNQGMRASRGEFIALLNNDAVVDQRWLEELVMIMRQDARIGSCASKILSYFDRAVFDNTGHVIFADGLTRGRGRLERDRGQYDRVEEVFCFSGAAALLRRAMLDDVGLFDDNFFAYCEEADLGFRARFRGWRCVYVPTAIVYHKFSASTETFSPFKALHVERNRLWLAWKNLPLPLLLASVPLTLQRYGWQAYGAFVGRGASGRFVQQRSRGSLVAILARAYLEALRGLPRVLAQRRAIQDRRLASTREVYGWLRRYGVGARAMALME